jgi:hypothetical protein
MRRNTSQELAVLMLHEQTLAAYNPVGVLGGDLDSIGAAG